MGERLANRARRRIIADGQFGRNEMRLWGFLIVGACLAAPGLAAAQEEILTNVPAPPPGETAWRTLSRTSGSIYLADVGAMKQADGVTAIRMARAPRTPGSAADREHAIETYQFRCERNQWRVVRTEEYGSDGREVDAWDEPDSAWLEVPAGSNMAFLKTVACDGEIPAGRAWGRLEDFLASNRS
ncbi:MAG: hypothetical protein K2X07_07680 [Caulobacteraceae bacterium]|nr:hypothetical protein [Caulobacteraceae bacterium]